MYKQFVQVSGLCGPQFLSYLPKRFTYLCRALYGDAMFCLLYTSDAADDLLCVDLGGRRIIKKKLPE